MNSNLLKGFMVLNNDNIKSLAEYLGISRQTLSLKIDGINEFKIAEIVSICEKYHLTGVQMIAIFFNEVWDESNGSSKDNGEKSSIYTDLLTTG